METPPPSETSGGATQSARRLSAALVIGLFAAAALALFIWLGREILEGEALAFDDRVRAAVHGSASPGVTAVMRAASLYGGPAVLVPIGVVLAVAFLIKGWRRGALLVVVTMAGAGLLDGVLKLFFARMRPTPFFDYPLPGSPSFPSGHALFATSFFGGLAALFSARLRSRVLQAMVWSVAISLIALVGLSRIYLGVHYPSDVLAGFAIGTTWVTAVAFGDRVARQRRLDRPT